MAQPIANHSSGILQIKQRITNSTKELKKHFNRAVRQIDLNTAFSTYVIVNTTTNYISRKYNKEYMNYCLAIDIIGVAVVIIGACNYICSRRAIAI